jgi:ABC-type uncharacterized transport system substrate-binding protein
MAGSRRSSTQLAGRTIVLRKAMRRRWVSISISLWMDELVSSGVILDFDANADAMIKKDELAAIGRQVVASIAGWSFYTFVRKADATLDMIASPTTNVTFDDKRSERRFDLTMKPKTRLDLQGGDASLSNVHDTCFVAFGFKSANDFAVKNMRKAVMPT